MSVDNTTPINTHNTNGVTTVFPFDFKILDAADLQLMFSLGALPTYTIGGVGDDDGGEVTFMTAPAGPGTLSLIRQLELNRTTDYQYQGELPSSVVNDDLDRGVMMVQQVNRDTRRSIKIPITDTSDQSLTADAATRAGKALVFDASGNITVSADNYDDQVGDVQALADAAAASASSAANSAAVAGNAATSSEASAQRSAASASFAAMYVSGGVGFTNSTYYDFGRVTDPIVTFPTDFGRVTS